MSESDNLRVVYLYRDAGNYKYWRAVVLRNPKGVGAAYFEKRLRAAFMVDGIFVASDIRLPDLFPYTNATATTDDHCFHELHSVESTTDASTDPFSRTIDGFLLEAEAAAARGWSTFLPGDPLERRFKLQL
jgi:hypothetical protein